MRSRPPPSIRRDGTKPRGAPCTTSGTRGSRASSTGSSTSSTTRWRIGAGGPPRSTRASGTCSSTSCPCAARSSAGTGPSAPATSTASGNTGRASASLCVASSSKNVSPRSLPRLGVSRVMIAPRLAPSRGGGFQAQWRAARSYPLRACEASGGRLVTSAPRDDTQNPSPLCQILICR